MKILVTGDAGFIGNAVTGALLAAGHSVVGVDCLLPYYDVALKQARLDRWATHAGYRHVHLDLRDGAAVQDLVMTHQPDAVVHLAAQAGVRHSLSHPHDYVGHNITASLNLLEALRHHPVRHFVFASSSSVYGGNPGPVFREAEPTVQPLSLYAASKSAGEAMAHAYSHLYGIPTTGLRFFTAYGPWGRPDMALFLFTKAMLAGETIRVHNRGDMVRDWTYIDDIVAGILAVLENPPAGPAAGSARIEDSSVAPFRIRNIGNGNPCTLGAFIDAVEARLEVAAKRELLPMQPGDVAAASADSSLLRSETNWVPATDVPEGIDAFITWYLEYYGEPTASAKAASN